MVHAEEKQHEIAYEEIGGVGGGEYRDDAQILRVLTAEGTRLTLMTKGVQAAAPEGNSSRRPHALAPTGRSLKQIVTLY